MTTYEYKQDVVDTKGKIRFDNVLNQRAREGWKVESIDKVGENFLVTYSRYNTEVAITVHDKTTQNNPDARGRQEIEELSRQGNRLVEFSSDGSQFYCVWDPFR